MLRKLKHILSYISFVVLLCLMIINLRFNTTDILSGNNENSTNIIIQSGFVDSIHSLAVEHFGFFISVSIFLLIILIVLNHRRYLAEKKFKQIDASYKAFINTSQDITFKFSKNGIIEQYFATNPEKLYKPPKEFLGKNIFEVLPEKVAGITYEALQECLKENRLVTIEYDLEVPEGKSTFEARLARYDINHATVVISDITERKTTHEHLKKLERAFEQAMDEIAVVDMDGYIEFANNSWAKNHGYKLDELIGKHLSIFHTKEQLENQVIPFNEILMEKGGNQGEVDHKRKDGSTFPTFMSSAIIRDDDGNSIGLVGIARDITERKEAELAIEKSEARFRELAELLPQTLFEIDSEGNITYTNRMGLETLRYSSEDVSKGLNALEMFIPEDQERVKANIKNSLQGILPESHEYTAVTKDGDRFPVMVYSSPIIQRGKPIGLRGVLFDITSIKEAETALRISEARYRELADSLPQSVFEIDTQGNIIFFNQTGCDSFGYTREELEKGINARQAFTVEDQKRIFTNIKKDLVGDYIEDREYTALRKDGTTFKVYAYSKPIIRNGQPVGLRGVLVDLTPFKEAEAAVAESEEKYRHLVENVDATISIIDKDGKYLFINGVGARSFSMEKEDIINKTLWDLFPKKIADNKISLIRQAIDSGKEQQVEVESILNGKPCWFYTIAQPYDFYPSIKKVVLIIAHDITEKKLAEQAVELSEEKYRLLVDNVSAIIALIDHNGTFHFVNKLAASQLSKTVENIVGKTMWDLFPREVADSQMSSIRKAIDTGQDLRRETRSFVNGKWHWYDTVVQPYNYDPNNRKMAMIISYDITDRKIADEALKSSEEKFRNFAEHSLQGVYIVQDDKFVFVNQKASDIIGIPVEKCLEMNVNDFLEYINSNDRDSARERYNARMNGDKIEKHLEVKCMTPKGEEKWLELFSQRTFLDNKKTLYGILIDITLRKKAEEDIRNAQQERYNTIRVITGGVSHEMYNALYPAMVAIDKLKNNVLKDQLSIQQIQHLLKMAESSVDRAINMTEAVTHYSRIESEKKVEVFDVNSLINEILESHKSRIEELGVDITLELKEEINCLCHKNHAFSIFNNLIINALDALSDVEHRRLIIKSVQNREFVKITIFDSGSGIAKDHIDKIFDPFYSTKPHTGTGLGLAMVKKIVDIYDGKITVKSSLDNGTEFVIFLRTPTLSES